MSPSLQHQRADDLRRRLAELAAETLKVEDELVAFEAEGTSYMSGRFLWTEAEVDMG